MAPFVLAPAAEDGLLEIGQYITDTHLVCYDISDDFRRVATPWHK